MKASQVTLNKAQLAQLINWTVDNDGSIREPINTIGGNHVTLLMDKKGKWSDSQWSVRVTFNNGNMTITTR